MADKVAAQAKKGDQIVVTVSAMSGETNRLIGLAKDMSEKPHPFWKFLNKAQKKEVLTVKGSDGQLSQSRIISDEITKALNSDRPEVVNMAVEAMTERINRPKAGNGKD